MRTPRLALFLVVVLLIGLRAGDATALGCNISWGGINTIVASIAECMKKERGKKDKGDAEEDGEPAACKEDPESKECETAKACEKSPASSDCVCGKAPKSEECQAAKDCEENPGSEACIGVGELDQCFGDNASPECKDDGPGTDGGPTTGDGPETITGGTETGGTGGQTGEGSGETAGDDDKSEGEEDKDEEGKDEEGNESKESLRAFAKQCIATTETLTAEARATSKDIAKSRVCKRIFDHGIQCQKKLLEEEPIGHDVADEFGIRFGGEGKLRTTKSWICYCFYSLRHQDALIERAKGDMPGYRFQLLKDRMARSYECQKPALSGILDERLAPQVGGGGGVTIRKNPFADESMTSATRLTKVLAAQCKSITKQLHGMIARSGSGALKEDLVRQIVSVAQYCYRQGISGAHDERRAPDPASDNYNIGKYCKSRKTLPGCAGF